MKNNALITPQESQPKLAEAVGVASLYFKREDLHPLGSHKGRSIPHMIDAHISAGNNAVDHKKFIISSSGNAALAAGLYVKELNSQTAPTGGAAAAVTLDILVGKNISPAKLAKLQGLKDDHITVSIHDRPLQILTVKTHEDPTIKSLRQSVDDSALAGYDSLAEELAQIPDLQAIFIGTSSGTTAQALAQYFLKNKSNTMQVEVHIVQTTSCHPMVQAVEESETDEKSIADAIVDNIAHRKDVLIPLIEETGGAGWIADNESIKIARELTQKHADLAISTNSALSVAGVMNAVYTSKLWTGAVVCIIAGE